MKPEDISRIGLSYVPQVSNVFPELSVADNLHLALWGGRAQLDTLNVDGSTGHIEGLTLRLFNPKTQEWRLYWANSQDGLVVAPQIGHFKGGHGEFYAQDTLDDRSILIKYDWSALHSNSPHFEQSFSNDGGKSWEVNWITDQSRVK